MASWEEDMVSLVNAVLKLDNIRRREIRENSDQEPQSTT